MLEGKKVVVGVCGGIAAYKAADFVSQLKKLGCEVFVVMTKSACEFISPLSLMTLSQNRVYTDMFDSQNAFEVEHISLAQGKDLFVIIPATANIIGKVAGGIADDLLTAVIMATKAPVLFAPAMNTNMYFNPIVQENINKLMGYGYIFIEPATGRLACGDIGRGKLADTHDIVERVIDNIGYEKDLKGLRVIVTAGPTREYIDPVRFISNPSSGKMGYEIARAAKYRGAIVTLIAGETAGKDINGVNIIKVTSAQDMQKAVIDRAREADIIIKSAAVGDFRSETVAKSKIKKTNIESINLVKNADILAQLGAMGLRAVIVGFCMETENLIENAMLKQKAKNADMIVANNINDEGAGFGGDFNKVTIIYKNDKTEDIPLMPKSELSHIILSRAFKLFKINREA